MFSQKIQPLLAGVSTSEIRSRIGVSRKVRVETNLYYVTPAPDGQLVWTAITDTFNPSDVHKAIRKLVRLVVTMNGDGTFRLPVAYAVGGTLVDPRRLVGDIDMGTHSFPRQLHRVRSKQPPCGS
jgi:hypothetical protein